MTVDAEEPRPHSFTPQQLGFTPRGPVPWLSPGQLAVTALRVVLSSWFGAYLDKRELQQALPDTVFDEGADDGERWFDYVSDIGDGSGFGAVEKRGGSRQSCRWQSQHSEAPGSFVAPGTPDNVAAPPGNKRP